MEGSDSVISAWDGGWLVGLVAVLSDGYLVASLSSLLAHPDYHGQGIGDGLMQRVVEPYAHCLRKVLITFDEKVGFDECYGFRRGEGRAPVYRRESDTPYSPRLLEIRTIPPRTQTQPISCAQPTGSPRISTDRTRAETGMTAVNMPAVEAGTLVIPANQNR